LDRLHINFCLPADWPGFMVHYRFCEAVYLIAILQPRAGEKKGAA